MAIRALSLIKNEADIIEENLRAAARWCDAIYVMDNGSADSTWDIVRDLAKEVPAIVPFRRESKPFSDSLRQEIFSHFRSAADEDDWWCILDADEFYVDDPREFLAGVPPVYRSVWPQLYTYLLTDIDAAGFGNGSAASPDSPAPERLRYYVLGEYSEPRFIRHDRRMTRFPPEKVHPIYPARIRMRHYPYRSPAQIQMRLATRREPMTRGEFTHEKRSNWTSGGRVEPGPAGKNELPECWQERIVPSSECRLDEGPDSLASPLPWNSNRVSAPPPRPRIGAAARLKHLLSAFLGVP